MDTFQEYKKIKEELNKTFDLNQLGFKADKIAEYIVEHPGEVPFLLVYKDDNGKTESDHKIRENLDDSYRFRAVLQQRNLCSSYKSHHS